MNKFRFPNLSIPKFESTEINPDLMKNIERPAQVMRETHEHLVQVLKSQNEANHSLANSANATNRYMLYLTGINLALTLLGILWSIFYKADKQAHLERSQLQQQIILLQQSNLEQVEESKQLRETTYQLETELKKLSETTNEKKR